MERGRSSFPTSARPCSSRVTPVSTGASRPRRHVSRSSFTPWAVEASAIRTGSPSSPQASASRISTSTWTTPRTALPSPRWEWACGPLSGPIGPFVGRSEAIVLWLSRAQVLELSVIPRRAPASAQACPRCRRVWDSLGSSVIKIAATPAACPNSRWTGARSSRCTLTSRTREVRWTAMATGFPTRSTNVPTPRRARWLTPKDVRWTPT